MPSLAPPTLRNDMPRSQTTLALRNEMLDLKKAGAATIQIDEATFARGPAARRDLG